MNEKQLQALARKNAAKAIKNQNKPRKSYDATLDATRSSGDEDAALEAQRMFKEMKRREF
ncbi:MAG: hypothetical protein U0163_11040 [Gemmatimonadaceae bacterium]